MQKRGYIPSVSRHRPITHPARVGQGTAKKEEEWDEGEGFREMEDERVSEAGTENGMNKR